MARQQSVCWHCGAQWESEPITLRATTGGRSDPQAAGVTDRTAAARG